MRRRLVLCLLVAALPAMAWAQKADYTGHKVVNVTLNSPEDVAAMLAISEDHWSEGVGVGTYPFRVPPDRMDDLDASGLSYVVIHDDVQQLIDAERAGVGPRVSWFDDYKTFAEINAYIDTLVASYPALVTKLTIGTTLQGRTVYGMKITSSVGGGTKPAVMFNGCQHAREWISPMTNMFIADQLIQTYGTDPDATAILDDLIVYVIPVVNADGYEYTQSVRLWRKNRRNNGDGTFGVDLNRNWPFAWGGAGSDGNTSSETYRGTAPASEPETQFMMAFCLAHPEIVAHIDFHSYGQLILYPYGHENNAPPPPEPDYSLFVNMSSDMADAIFAVHNVNYTDEVSWMLYPAAGTMPDWFYDETGALSWTIELRNTSSFILAASQIIPTGEENYEAIKVLTTFATTVPPLSISANGPETVEPDTSATVSVTVNEDFGTVQAGSEKLFTRIGSVGPFSESALAPLGGGAYEGSLPPTPCGETIEYYVQVESMGGSFFTAPADAPAGVYATDVIETIAVLADDMEADLGWTVGAAGDTATTGVWVRVDPLGTLAQPENDHSDPGSTCWVTGQGTGGSIGENDVDGGATTLLTPVMDLTGSVDPQIQYWRWFSNDEGSAANSDTFAIDITDDGVNWTNVETVGPTGIEASGGWFYHEARVLDFVALTSQVQLRFVAADLGTGSIVECAVDDFLLADIGCFGDDCLGDVDGDGVVDLTDLAVLLSNFDQSGAGVPGDLDGSGTVDLTDLALLLSAFDTVCP